MGIMESIIALANSPHDMFAKDDALDADMEGANDNDGDDNGDENGEDQQMENDELERDSQHELNYLHQLSKSTNDFSNRCSKFQQYLLKLIKNTSSTNGGSAEASHSKKEMVQVANFERQIASLQSTCSALELQVKELGKARDEANNSERRVRRGLYRVAAGRLKIGEVLQVS
jgi:hypothetical protein